LKTAGTLDTALIAPAAQAWSNKPYLNHETF
jgi:hypothetical protein